MKRKDGRKLLTLIGLIVVATAFSGKAPSKPKANNPPLKPGGGKFGGGGASGSW